MFKIRATPRLWGWFLFASFLLWLVGLAGIVAAAFVLEVGASSILERLADLAQVLGGILAVPIAILTVYLLALTYHNSVEQKEEAFVLEYAQHVLALNRRIVEVYNNKHDKSKRWKSDDGLVLILKHIPTNSNPARRGEEMVRKILDGKQIGVFFELEQLLQALEFLILWDSKRAEFPSRFTSGFVSKHSRLLVSLIPFHFFQTIDKFGILNTSRIRRGMLGEYRIYFPHLKQFVDNLGDQYSSSVE